MKDQRIRKPMNSFFYYRKAIRSKIIELYKTDKSNEISKIAAECWKLESIQVKEYYANVSKLAHEEHRIKNPGFNWQPWKSKAKEVKVAKRSITTKNMKIPEVIIPPLPCFVSPDVLMSVHIEGDPLPLATVPQLRLEPHLDINMNDFLRSFFDFQCHLPTTASNTNAVPCLN